MSEDPPGSSSNTNASAKPTENSGTHRRRAHRRMTTDPDRIREWAESRDAVPVSYGGEGSGSSHDYTFVRRNDLEDHHEAQSWDEFSETFGNEDLVFVYEATEPAAKDRGHGATDTAETDVEDEADAQPDADNPSLGTFELVDRTRAFDRVELGESELEDQLRQGERVTTELVETQRIERDIVERDTLESEIVDSELLERRVVDSELLDREAVDIEFIDESLVEVTTDEARLETVEEIERYAVESRVVDVDIDHNDALTRDEIETDDAFERVQESILESDIVRTDADPAAVVEQEVIESKRGEGDTVRSDLIERRTVEDEIDERLVMRFALEDSDILDSELVSSTVLEGEIIDSEEYETMAAEEMRSPAGATGDAESGEGATGEMGAEAEPGGMETSEMESGGSDQTEALETGTAGNEETAAGEGAEMAEPSGAGAESASAEAGTGSAAGDEMETGAGEMDETRDGTEKSEMGAEPESKSPGESESESVPESETPTVDPDATVSISASDQGKNVVDEAGNQIGIISTVEEGTAYVDPKPGLTDRLRARLNWGGHSDDEYPVEPAQITAVREDEVVVRSE
ncbi:hypothetical protein [Natrialba sp. PRR66]|uniref:hypothetical protein n=1 Tax=Natrialba sp. PRR66 TaxID=3098146 RepID=UPI002B1D7B89|nr:hypothetical protein [Natrialba sp. PRR66]